MPSIPTVGAGPSAATDPLAGYYLFDSFTDTDAVALVDHTAEKGGAWTVRAGTPAISSNTLVEDGGATDDRYTQDASQADGTLQATLNTDAANTYRGILFREASDQTAIMTQIEASSVSCYTRTPGYSQIGTTGFTHVGGADEVLKVVLSGSSIEILIDDVSKLDLTNSTNQTETRHGFRADYTGGPENYFDDWSMVP